MTRSNAREIAVHLVFSSLYHDATAEELLSVRFDDAYHSFLAEACELYAEKPNDKQMSYIRNVVSGVLNEREFIDNTIRKYLSGWTLERVSRISRAIMEVAVYEIRHVEDVPAAAAANEAVELCKKYDEESAASFVNGVLGNVIKEGTDHVSGT